MVTGNHLHVAYAATPPLWIDTFLLMTSECSSKMISQKWCFFFSSAIFRAPFGQTRHSTFIAPINEKTFWEKLRLLALQVIILQIRGGIDISWVWFLTNVTHTNEQRKRERERAECMHIVHGNLGIVSLVTCGRQLLHIFWWWEMM